MNATHEPAPQMTRKALRYEINLATQEPQWVKRLVLGLSCVFFVLFILMPLIVVFAQALQKGLSIYLELFEDSDTRAAIAITLAATLVAVPLNVVFGVVAAWLIAKFDFMGKHFLITLIDLPFSVSPVIAGLMYVLLLGSGSAIGEWLLARDIEVIFAIPGIILATTFVTFPFVARELIPLMQAQGREEEEAAVVLGANAFQTFYHVTLPNIKWGLMYGVILCNARAMGEFGAVSVVSGHIRGLTNTMPLHIEILYNEYQTIAAFAVASLLALLALFTLAIKTFVEWRIESVYKNLTS